MNSNEYADILSRKRIAVVGRSQTLISDENQDHGSLIDSYDLIIRINTARPIGHSKADLDDISKYIGSRTEVLYANRLSHRSSLVDGKIYKDAGMIALCGFDSRERYMPDVETLEQFVPYHSVRDHNDNFLDAIREDCTDLAKVSKGKLKESYLSQTGIGALKHLITFPFKEMLITGFTSGCHPDETDYFDILANHPFHDAYGDLYWLQCCQRIDDRITTDATLQSVFNLHQQHLDEIESAVNEYQKSRSFVVVRLSRNIGMRQSVINDDIPKPAPQKQVDDNRDQVNEDQISEVDDQAERVKMRRWYANATNKKRIAFVGSSDTIYSDEYQYHGELIDSYDLVTRINHVRHIQSQSRYVGNRTDIVYANRDGHRKVFANPERYKNWTMLSGFGPRERWLPEVTEFEKYAVYYSVDDNDGGFLSKTLKDCANIAKATKMKRKYATRTELTALKHMMTLPFKEMLITGVTAGCHPDEEIFFNKLSEHSSWEPIGDLFWLWQCSEMDDRVSVDSTLQSLFEMYKEKLSEMLERVEQYKQNHPFEIVRFSRNA